MAGSKRNEWTSTAAGAIAFGRRHFVLVALVAADVATKSLAFGLLPGGETIPIAGGVGFYLTLNEWGVLGGVQGISAVTANSVYTVMLATALLGLAVMVRKLAALRLPFAVRTIAGVVIFFVVANVIQLLAQPFAHVALPPDLVIYAIRIAALVVSLSFYSVSRAALPCAIFTLLSAGSLANAVSYAYPPFEVIDFLRVPLPGRDHAFGVLNLADVYIALSLAMGLLWPLIALIRMLTGLVRNTTVTKGTRRTRIRRGTAAAEIAD